MQRSRARIELCVHVAAAAFALVGALEVQDGRAGNTFALAMNMLEGEANLLRIIWPCFQVRGSRAEPAQFQPGRLTGRPMLQRESWPASRTREYTAHLPATSTVRREVCA